MKLDRVTFFLQLFFRSFSFFSNFLIRKAGVVPCSFEVSFTGGKVPPKLQFGLIVRPPGATLFDHGTIIKMVQQFYSLSTF